jgi:transcriptional regulator with XRE-family HTH domain
MSQEQAPQVGPRIRVIRERQGLSLRALAKRCGLSINAISLIERGHNSPTVSSLHLLATALGVSITDFFQDEHEQAIVYVRPESRLSSASGGISMESLGIGLRNQQLEPFLMVVASRAGNVDRPISHAGEEFVYCLEGAVQYHVGSESYALESGHSLLFDAGLPHGFRNPTDGPSRLLMVFVPGQGGHLAREMHMAPGENEQPDS